MSAVEIIDGEIVEREIPGIGLVRFEDLGPGEWLTQKGEPAKKARRRYLLNGDDLDSVSSITGTIEKPALYAWYEDHGARGGAEAVRMGELEGVAPEDVIRKVRELGLGADKQRDEAADRGKAIHTAFERLALCGEPPRLADYPQEWHPWIRGAAKAWLLLNPQPQEAEQIVCNPLLNYAGRPDLIAVVNGELTLIDYKTGKGRIYEQAHYQTRLYEMAYSICSSGFIENILIVGIDDDGGVQFVKCEATPQDALDLIGVYRSRKLINRGMAEQRAALRKAVSA